MIQAHREGRIDDMLELIHPEVHWRPLFRPGLAVCVGRPAVRQLVEQITAALGRYWFDLDDVTERGDGGVRALARLRLAVRQIDADDDLVEFNISFQDGLVHEVLTLPGRTVASTPWHDADPTALTATTVRLARAAIVVLDGVLGSEGRLALLGAVRDAVAGSPDLVQVECYGITAVGADGVDVLRQALGLAAADGVRAQVLRPSQALRAAIAADPDPALDVVD